MSAVSDVDASGVSRRRRAAGIRFLVVAAAGLAVGLSWQPFGLWPLLLFGLPAFTLAVSGRQLGGRAASKGGAPAALSLSQGAESVTPRFSFVLGYLFGFIMLAVTISWVHVLGIWIALVLIAFESIFEIGRAHV